MGVNVFFACYMFHGVSARTYTELAGGYWIMLECVDNNPHWAVTKETETPEGCLKK